MSGEGALHERSGVHQDLHGVQEVQRAGCWVGLEVVVGLETKLVKFCHNVNAKGKKGEIQERSTLNKESNIPSPKSNRTETFK